MQYLEEVKEKRKLVNIVVLPLPATIYFGEFSRSRRMEQRKLRIKYTRQVFLYWEQSMWRAGMEKMAHGTETRARKKWTTRIHSNRSLSPALIYNLQLLGTIYGHPFAILLPFNFVFSCLR